MTSSSLISSCWVDSDYRIVKVGGNWDQFALENGGESLISEHITGAPLFSYVTSDATRMYLRLILDHVRHIERESVRPYRCDSPEQKRYMEMRVALDEDRMLRLDHYLISTESITPPIQFISSSPSEMEYLKRCSMCNRIEVEHQWMEADRAFRGGWIEDQVFQPIYTVCESCRSGVAPDCCLSAAV